MFKSRKSIQRMPRKRKRSTQIKSNVENIISFKKQRPENFKLI